MKTRSLRGGLIAGAAILVGSCGGGGGWGWDIEYGYLTVRLADSAVDDALAMVVQVEAVDARVSGANNPQYDFDRFRLEPAEQIDVLQLSDGRSRVLVEKEVVLADRWDWIRLVIKAGLTGQDSYVETATGRYALFMPEDNSRGLLIRRSFVVPKDRTLDLTIDFDLRQSIIPPEPPSNLYILEPVLRFVETDKAGRIEGLVEPSLMGPECTPVVYGFSGADITPDDIDRSAPEPVTEGAVRLDAATGDFRYVLAWLPAGDYTIALTCQGDLDRPDRDDTPALEFHRIATAVVVAGESTRIDFQAG